MAIHPPASRWGLQSGGLFDDALFNGLCRDIKKEYQTDQYEERSQGYLHYKSSSAFTGGF